MALSPLVDRYENLVLDLDGCVWVGDACTRGAPEAIAQLRAASKRLVFVTNDSRRSPEDYVRKLWSLGLQASLEEVVTVGAAIQYVLAERDHGDAYVIGAEAHMVEFLTRMLPSRIKGPVVARVAGFPSQSTVSHRQG